MKTPSGDKTIAELRKEYESFPLYSPEGQMTFIDYCKWRETHFTGVTYTTDVQMPKRTFRDAFLFWFFVVFLLLWAAMILKGCWWLFVFIVQKFV